MIYRPDLIEADVFILIAEADMHVPRPFAQLRRCGGDEIKAVRQFPHNEDRAREPIAFAVDFRPDILPERCPPQITLGDERRLMFRSMQFSLEPDPLKKAVHALDYTNRRIRPLITRAALIASYAQARTSHFAHSNPPRLKVTSHLIRT